MKKNLTLVAIATLFTCACASTLAQAPDCPPSASLQLTIGEYHISLNDNRPICVSLPGTINITIKDPPGFGYEVDAGEVTAEAKFEGDVTIVGNNNSPTNKLKIEVDGTADPNDVFAFWIKVEGVGELDPKVRVVDNDVIERLHSEALYDLLGTLGISLEDANKLRPPWDSYQD